MAISETSDEFVHCYNIVKNFIKDDSINVNNLLDLAVTGMEAVEDITTLSGSEKKELVIMVIQKLIKESDILDDDKKSLLGTITDIIPKAIDIIIQISKGKTNLNKGIDAIKKVKFCCC